MGKFVSKMWSKVLVNRTWTFIIFFAGFKKYSCEHLMLHSLPFQTGWAGSDGNMGHPSKAAKRQPFHGRWRNWLMSYQHTSKVHLKLQAVQPKRFIWWSEGWWELLNLKLHHFLSDADLEHVQFDSSMHVTSDYTRSITDVKLLRCDAKHLCDSFLGFQWFFH